MKRRVTTAAATALALLAVPVVAQAATTWCVQNPGCTGNHTQSTITGAIGAASSGDTISIGPGTFNEHPNAGSTSLTIIGSGPSQTIVDPASSSNSVTTLDLSGATNSVSSLGIRLATGTSGDEGLRLNGTATNLSVSSSGGTNAIGIALFGNSTVGSSTVTLPTGAGTGTTGISGSGTNDLVRDSAVTADTAVSQANATRVRLTANQGMLEGASFGSLTATVDDALIVLLPGSSPPVGVNATASAIAAVPASLSLTLRHLTVIGNGDPASKGVSAAAVFAGFPASTTVSVASSIVRGTGHPLSQSAGGGTTASLSVDYSDYDPSGLQGTINQGSHSINADPLLLPTDELPANSPAVDTGDPAAPAAGESTTDLAGQPRVAQGRPAGARTDMGAFEFQPHPPAVTVSGPPALISSSVASNSYSFTATGSDPDAGDQLAYAWRADDGATGTGPSFTHTFTSLAGHSATVTVTDLEGQQASATSSFIVYYAPNRGGVSPTPVLSALAISPAAFRAAPAGGSIAIRRTGTTISYRDSVAATTTFTVLRSVPGRRRGRACVKPSPRLRRHHARRCMRVMVVGSFSHRDAAGSNRLHFTGRVAGRRLRPGGYTVRAVASASGLRSAPATRAFRIIR